MSDKSAISIGAPRIVPSNNGTTRLVSVVYFEGCLKEVWLSVDDKYSQYLCAERGDAFVIGLLPVAMRRGLDIVCETPVSERLLFQLRSTLLPLLAKYGKNVHEVKIDAPIAIEPVANAGGVGAGISCGVDSLHIVKNHSGDEYPGLKLTHLVLNNVGAFFCGGKVNDSQLKWTIDLTRKFCEEYGYELILTDSNIFEFTNKDFEVQHTYLNVFAVYCLQKLWKVFYYGSGGIDFMKGFTLVNHEHHDCSAYDLLLLDCLSTENLEIYSEGAAFERLDKIAHIVDFEPAQKYLEVCVQGVGKNCGRCVKCARTLLMLDYLGALDKFGKVFDVEAYKRDRHWYLRYLYRCQLRGHEHRMLDRVYERFSSEISLVDKVLVLLTMVKNLFLRFK